MVDWLVMHIPSVVWIRLPYRVRYWWAARWVREWERSKVEAYWQGRFDEL